MTKCAGIDDTDLPLGIAAHRQMSKSALITGVTGQDGAYFARLLVDNG